MSSCAQPHVTIMRHPRVRSWPVHARGRRCYSVPLSYALMSTYASDAHFGAYRSDRQRRLSTASVGQVDVEMTCLVLDVDCAAVHGTSEPAPASWRAELERRFAGLLSDHPGGYLYHTRGGARIVYRIEPMALRTPRDAALWRARYAVTCAWIGAEYSIEADLACGDWTRLYRLPHAMRDAGSDVEDWGGVGDPSEIGVLRIAPSAAHVERAKVLLPTAFPRSRMPARVGNLQGMRQRVPAVWSSDPRGALYEALEARGDVLASHRLGWVIRCPNAGQHTSGREGDGSTVLIAPGAGQTLGCLRCLHAHCARLQAADWLALLGIRGAA